MEDEQEEIDLEEKKNKKANLKELKGLEEEMNKKKKTNIQPDIEKQAQIARLLEVASRFPQLAVNDFGAVLNNEEEILLMPYNNSGIPLCVLICNKNAIKKLLNILS